MVSKKTERPVRPSLTGTEWLEQLVWLAVYVFALLALLLKHNGKKLPARGAAHMAAELADEGVMEFLTRFSRN